jgi:hypothetical protein
MQVLVQPRRHAQLEPAPVEPEHHDEEAEGHRAEPVPRAGRAAAQVLGRPGGEQRHRQQERQRVELARFRRARQEGESEREPGERQHDRRPRKAAGARAP